MCGKKVDQVDALASIANCVDFDVEQIRNQKTKTEKPPNDELDHRQRKLRRKLDGFLEETHKTLFNDPKKDSHSSKRKKKHRRQKDDDLNYGIRLFKEVPIGIPVDLSKPVQKRPSPKKTKHKNGKSRPEKSDGVTRFQGLAVIDTESILKDAYKIKEQGRLNLHNTSPNKV